MRKHTFILFISLILSATAQLAFAKGNPGGGGGKQGGGMGHRAGGQSMQRMHDSGSGSGHDNSNAQFREDSTRGLERARSRMSEQGLEHEKASEQEHHQESDN